MAVPAILTQQSTDRIYAEVQSRNLTRVGGLWGPRFPDVDATPEEIIARDSNIAIAANLIVNDAPSPTRDLEPISMTGHKVANLKDGIPMKQSDMEMIQRLQAMNLPSDRASLSGIMATRWDLLRRGNLNLRGFLCAATMLDELNWDRLGIKLSGLNFGLNPGLKVTPQVLWTDTANADPVRDIIDTVEDFATTYDLVVDRATISTYGLNLIKNTDKFKDQMKAAMGVGFALATNGNAQAALQKNVYLGVLGSLTGIAWEIDDNQITFRNPAGGTTTTRYVPQNKLILSASSADGDSSWYNFGNCVVDESTSRGVKGTDPAGSRRGPYPYIGSPNGDENPPGFTQWLVSKGMARRMIRNTNGVLTFA
ncbi:MAG: hypothetical protein ACO1SV_21545 [Fimbriimonas sp.]